MKSVAVIVAALGIGSMVGLCLPKEQGPGPVSRIAPAFEVPEGRELAPMPRVEASATPAAPAAPVYSDRVVTRKQEPQPRDPIIITTSSILGRTPPAPNPGNYSAPRPPSYVSSPSPVAKPPAGAAGKRC